MTAPSHTTCFKTFTPVKPTTPMRIVTDLLIDVLQPAVDGNVDSDHTSGEKYLIDPQRPLRHAIKDLSQSSLDFLTTEPPIKSSAVLPDIATMLLSPVKRRDLVTFEPRMSCEQQFADVLLAKDAEIQLLKSQTMRVQATMILQQLYCKQVRSQLGAKELKQEKKGEKGGKLHSDVLPLGYLWATSGLDRQRIQK